jgi:hypothetical protein
MFSLDTFRIIGKHFAGILSGIYIAGIAAQLLMRLWPSARLPAFIIISLFFAFAELSVMIRELHKGRLSTGVIVLDFMPFFLLGTGVSLLIGELVARWLGSDIFGVVVFFGAYSCLLFVIALTKQAVQERNLREDLENSPNTNRPAYLRDVLDIRAYSLDKQKDMPHSVWTLPNMGKALIFLITIALMFLLISMFSG